MDLVVLKAIHMIELGGVSSFTCALVETTFKIMVLQQSEAYMARQNRDFVGAVGSCRSLRLHMKDETKGVQTKEYSITTAVVQTYLTYLTIHTAEPHATHTHTL